MDRRRLASLTAALLVLAAAALPARSQEGGPLCAKCKSSGRIPNKFLTPALADLESRVLHCSYAFETDRKGRGLPWTPCEGCRNPELAAAALREFDAIVAAKEKWLAREKASDAMLATELLHVETEHFVIAWDIPKIVTRDKKTYKCHEALHLYADRMEAFYKDFMDFLQIDEKEVRNRKHQVFLFEAQKHCLKAAKDLTGLNCWNAAKLPGSPSILVSWFDRQNLPEDDDLHRHVIHHLSHLLNVSYYRMEWLAMDAGWADEGLAHFFEYRTFAKADNTCDEEGEEEALSHSDWEFEVREKVAAGQGPSFAEMSKKSVTALFGEEHQFAWSFMDFLLKKRPPESFKVFMRAIKDKQEVRDALDQAYGLNVITFQSAWEAYVLETYRTKPLKAEAQPRRLR